MDSTPEWSHTVSPLLCLPRVSTERAARAGAHLHVLAAPVELRLGKQHISWHILVQHPSHELGEWREEQVKEYQVPLINHGRCREATVELEPEQEADEHLWSKEGWDGNSHLPADSHPRGPRAALGLPWFPSQATKSRPADSLDCHPRGLRAIPWTPVPGGQEAHRVWLERLNLCSETVSRNGSHLGALSLPPPCIPPASKGQQQQLGIPTNSPRRVEFYQQNSTKAGETQFIYYWNSFTSVGSQRKYFTLGH